MSFLKRSIVKRFDIFFRRKKRGKFVDCVHKVIEARRSGCIDEEGNILKPLNEMLVAHDKLRNGGQVYRHHHQDSPSEEALKVGEKRSPPLVPQHRAHRISVRDSYPLPEEDDGSEGYASAGETEDSFNPTAFLERNRRSSRRFSNNSEDGSHSSRRVRFSDEVTRFGGPGAAEKDEEVSSHPAAPAEKEQQEEPDLSALPLIIKIKYFEGVVVANSEKTSEVKNMTAATGDSSHLLQPPIPRASPCPGSPEIRHRVKLFEDICKGIRVDPPQAKPRRAVQSCQYTQTKSKINFFEQLSHEH